MKLNHGRLALWIVNLFLLCISNVANAGLVKGIYITQSTAENTKYFNYLITRAKQVGIDTFIVDLEIPSKRYAQNMQLLKDNHINYVARIEMFPGGGTPEQIQDKSIREKKLKLMQQAIAYGANEIQLDYIRYNTRSGASSQHAQDIYQIISGIKAQLAKQNIPLQIDVFGISSFGEEKHIGQNVNLFSTTVNAICPMVYPSHYEPFRYHAVRPYETVYDSLVSIRKQINPESTARLIPYIELSNYRYPLSHQKKMEYIYAQIKAVEDAGANGWYVWSAHNKYDNLFAVLEKHPTK